MKNKFILHLDMNSFFASCEQQANFALRHRPVAVVAYPGPNSVVLAASIEAKKYGVKTGASARQAKILCPEIIFLENDPPKYRAISDAVLKLLQNYSDDIFPYSIDENFLDLTGWVKSWSEARAKALEIKKRLQNEVGDWLRCSIGISWTRFLAKVGSDINKPDGLTIITPADLPRIYNNLELTDLWGIAAGWRARLARVGIATIRQLYDYPLQNLVSIFGKPGYYLYANIHGLDINPILKEQVVPKSISHQYAIPVSAYNPYPLPKKGEEKSKKNPFLSKEGTEEWLLPKILMKLSEKVGRRLRKHELLARTIFVGLRYYRSNRAHHPHGKERGNSKNNPLLAKERRGDGLLHKKLNYAFASTLDIYHHGLELLKPNIGQGTIHVLSIGVSDLINRQNQLSFWSTKSKALDNKIDVAMDKIKNKYGDFAIAHGTVLGGEDFVPDRIGFRK